MQFHELKTWPDPFDAVFSGQKTAELRLDDRRFAIGDVLVLREWDPADGDYSGRTCYRHISHMAGVDKWVGVKTLHDCDCGLGWVMLSLKPCHTDLVMAHLNFKAYPPEHGWMVSGRFFYKDGISICEVGTPGHTKWGVQKGDVTHSEGIPTRALAMLYGEWVAAGHETKCCNRARGAVEDGDPITHCTCEKH